MSTPDHLRHSLDASRIRTVLCDLDGVVWLAHRPIAGSVEAIAGIRRSGRRVVFVTNNSAARLTDHEAALAAIGVPAAGDVVSSAVAAAQLVAPGDRVLVTGGPGIADAVERRGAVAIPNVGTLPADPVDAVVVGLDRQFDYARLAAAHAAVRTGARLIGTNSDPTYPTPDGLTPGGGAILAAVATASGRIPEIAGKPHPPMAALLATVVGADPTSALMVGDRPDTDGEMAAAIGCPFALVRSGVTDAHEGPGQDAACPVALDVADLAGVAVALGAA